MRPPAPIARLARRGAPPRRALARAVGLGALAQLCGVAMVGGATGLFVWAARRPSLAEIAGPLVVIELVAFLRAPLRHAARLASHDLGLGGLARWRRLLLRSVASWPPSRLAVARTGDLLSRCLEDTDALQDLWVRVAVPFAGAVVALAVTSAVVLVLQPVAGAGLLVGTIAVTWACWKTAPELCILGAARAELQGAAAARVVELSHGAEALSRLGALHRHEAATSALLARRDALEVRLESRLSRLVLVAAVVAGLVVVLAASSSRLPTAHPEVAAAVVLASLACAELFLSLPASLEHLGAVAGAAARLDAVAPEPSTVRATAAAAGALHLEGVSVGAGPTGPVLLEDVTVAVDHGDRIAVFGPTGSGKSTLLATAAGLEPPRGGVVRLGTSAIGDVDDGALRARLVWVPEASGLLGGRVRDVLDAGRHLPDDAMWRALDDTGLAEVIAARGGLDAVIADRGDNLSVGERRRLAIARALAGDPALLVLDEPTSGLDATAAATLLAALSRRGAGVLIATHDAAAAAWATTRRRVARGTLADDQPLSDDIARSG